MKLLTVDTIEEARQKIAGVTAHWKLPVEQLDVQKTVGRILGDDIISQEDIPGFRRSTVDGYAVISAETAGAGESMPVFLKLVGSVEMGQVAAFRLGSGECAYVPTGGMVPDGADAMVMIEHSEAFGGEIALYESAAFGSGVAQIGEDASKGALLLKRGTMIHSQQVGALAAAGITQVPVCAPLRLSIISSGDELVPPASRLKLGEMRDVNSFALEALAAESGYNIVSTQTLPDDEAQLEEAVRSAMQTSDVVAISGGSSQGAKDFTGQIFSRLAQPGVFTWGLAVKPGKPAILAYDKASDSLLVGLPGHPVSALIVFRALLSWLARRLGGEKEAFPIPAKIARNIAGAPGRTTYQPVALKPCGMGYLAEPVFGKAGMISTLTASDGYIVIDLNKEGLKEGEEVQVHLWN
ncbi:MAG: molybdopterin molybdotransferase MoeA [Spirochaetes bacterium]|nr:molybdopterin molybdotransferase MoeA [Spirochaetota bacterium]